MTRKRRVKSIFKDLLEEYSIRVYHDPDACDYATSGRNKQGNETITVDFADPRVTLCLAHEIGHIALGHTAYKANEVTGQYFLDSEVDAWLYAEEVCKGRGLPFDYEWALECYLSHVDTVRVKALWNPEKYSSRLRDLRQEWRYHG